MGSSGGNAQKEAQRAEEQRQAQIQNTQRNIERAFTTPQREQDIGKFLDATRQYYRADADRQQGDASRNVRFAVARSGQAGGTFDADTNARLSETYQRGVIEADRRAQAAAANLRTQDQAAKQQLFALAQSGLDSGTAMAQSAQALRQNLDQSRVTANEGSLGDLFGSFGDVYKNSVAQDEARKAQRDVYGTLFQKSQYGSGYKGGS